MNSITNNLKNSARHDDSLEMESQSGDCFASRNWALFGVGIAAMILGYALLAMVERTAGGMAGRISPLLIVGGLVVFALGYCPRSAER